VHLPNDLTRTKNYIGKSNWADPLYGGSMSEIIIYNRALDNTERAEVEEYLQKKYVPLVPGTASLPGGTFTEGQSVTLSTGISGAEIRYTTNGTDPTSSSTLYSGALSISSTTILKFKVFKTGYLPSATVTYVYTIDTGLPELPRDGLQVWFNSGLGVSKDDSNKVSEWVDQSGNGYLAQITGSQRPLWVEDVTNDQPVLRFDGSNDYLMTNYTGVGGNEMTLVVVTKGSNYQSLLCMQNGSSHVVYPWSGAGLALISSNGGGYDSISAGLRTGEWNVGVQTYKVGDRQNCYRNGVLASTKGAGGSLPSQVLRLGSNNGSSEFMNADVAEILIYNRVLTAAEQRTVEGYLAKKYDVYTPVLAAPVVTPPNKHFLDSQSVTMTHEFDGAEIRYTTDDTEPTTSSTLYTTALNVTVTTHFKVKAFKTGFTSSPTVVARIIKAGAVPFSEVRSQRGSGGYDFGQTMDRARTYALTISGGLAAVSWGASRVVDSTSVLYTTDDQPDWFYGGSSGTYTGPVPREVANLYNGGWSGISYYGWATVFQKRTKIRGEDEQVYTLAYRILEQDLITGAKVRTGEPRQIGGWHYVQFTGEGTGVDTSFVEHDVVDAGAYNYDRERWMINDDFLWPGNVFVGLQVAERLNWVTVTGLRPAEADLVKVVAKEVLTDASSQENVDYNAKLLADGTIQALEGMALDVQHRTRLGHRPGYFGQDVNQDQAWSFASGVTSQDWGTIQYVQDWGTPGTPPGGWQSTANDYTALVGSFGYNPQSAVNSQSRFRMKLPEGVKVYLTYLVREWNCAMPSGAVFGTTPPVHTGVSGVVKKVVLGPFIGQGLATWSDWVEAPVTDKPGYNKFRRNTDFEVHVGYPITVEEVRSSEVEAGLKTAAAHEALDWNDDDNDGLPNWKEAALGTDPDDADSNDDGLTDGRAYHLGFDPLEDDNDDDGLTNAQEYALGTNAFWNDTDGDGVLDGADAFPFDPSRSSAPSSNPGDTTAPTITLEEPIADLVP
jgi:hypothetical protein